jgi:hypothetical protein
LHISIRLKPKRFIHTGSVFLALVSALFYLRPFTTKLPTYLSWFKDAESQTTTYLVVSLFNWTGHLVRLFDPGINGWLG